MLFGLQHMSNLTPKGQMQPGKIYTADQGWIQSWTLGGGAFDSFYCLFNVRNFLTLLFAIGNIAIWEVIAFSPFGSAPAADIEN